MPTPDPIPDPAAFLPSPRQLREQLARVLKAADLLKGLLRLVERHAATNACPPASTDGEVRHG